MKNLEYFKEKLLALRAEVTSRIEKIDTGVCHEGITPDLDDQAIELENEEVLSSLSHTSRRELEMVDEAMKRMDSGKYFTCRSCGESIPENRLEALPFSNQCVKCAENMEHT